MNFSINPEKVREFKKKADPKIVKELEKVFEDIDGPEDLRRKIEELSGEDIQSFVQIDGPVEVWNLNGWDLLLKMDRTMEEKKMSELWADDPKKAEEFYEAVWEYRYYLSDKWAEKVKEIAEKYDLSDEELDLYLQLMWEM